MGSNFQDYYFYEEKQIVIKILTLKTCLTKLSYPDIIYIYF